MLAMIFSAIICAATNQALQLQNQVNYEHLRYLEDEFKENMKYAEKMRDSGDDKELERTAGLLYVIQGFICAEDGTRENCEFYNKDLSGNAKK